MKKINGNVKQNSARDWAWSHSGEPCTSYEKDLIANRSAAKPLDADVEADVAIIGGGFLGLSAAITLAEAGKSVVLLEKDKIGDGASGRNGGHLSPGLGRWGVTELVEKFGEEKGAYLWDRVSSGSFLFNDKLIERYKIPAERVRGHLTLAYHPNQMDGMRKIAEEMNRYGYESVSMVSKEELGNYISSPIYHGAALDSQAGHLNPLAYVQGLANVARGFKNSDGNPLVRIYENTEAVEIDNKNKKIKTLLGTVSARDAIVLGAHIGTDSLSASAGAKTIKVSSYQCATNPLSTELINTILPNGYAGFDTQLVMYYFRISKSNRLIFGSLSETSLMQPSEAIDVLSKSMLTAFPQLRDHHTIEHAWSGTMDVTYNGAVHVTKNIDDVYIVNGWNGHGVAQSPWLGSVVARAILGDDEDFRMLSSIKHMPIPMGKWITPYVFPVFMLGLKLVRKMYPGTIVKF